ncbi:40S ribosomal protein S30 [Trichoplax sp. H2]|uniref:Ubiquitin-like domain-containing protein n=1 Tax=Trichoplax adhaerens TaxID=10228 RepID=B3S7G8_TRIAD|nr:expressed hypothetical protein [Trichoplax adhaerens]EDV21196.1 expressed hypothetical protein [Trichoplax adhaerens]RDD47600.1 40S ribosomal protein S30 [Trichoplax sp. H2]|eukprot:XP_002116163.1 expressed hypothetical protein [Trichoplax adhaerens]
MNIFLRGNSSYTYNCSPATTIADLKHYLNDREGLPVTEQVITYGLQVLEDHVTLADYAIEADSTLNAFVRLHGGKVHGSLARAGKVKNQTPKVEQQEKKKKKTGRSKRRMQYNRRFVNVVQGFGRKKGPNSNSS